jgi:SAM-dependent methyltransferase
LLTNEEKERKENDFWANDPEEKPGVFGIYGVINKMYEAKAFLEKLTKYKPYFSKARSIVELGAGQGWASCIVKHLFVDSTVYATDLCADAIKSLPKWEKIFNVTIDKSYACKSNELPFEDGSIDLVFCFQAAHHFSKQKSTLEEIHRILKPGGVCLYLREPSCRKYIYPLAYKRVNNGRPMVPEDVLIYKDIIKIGKRAGFHVDHAFDTSCTAHHGFAGMYYFILSKIGFLKHLLPCTSNITFIKG